MSSQENQEKVAKFLLRVCTGKDPQKIAKAVAAQLTEYQAGVAITYARDYTVPDLQLLAKILSTFGKQLDPLRLRVVIAVVPVMNQFGVDSEMAVSYLISITNVAEKPRYAAYDQLESLVRGIMIGFIVMNTEVETKSHLCWVGDNAVSLSAHAGLLKLRRSISRSTCDLALAGVEYQATLHDGIL